VTPDDARRRQEKRMARRSNDDTGRLASGEPIVRSVPTTTGRHRPERLEEPVTVAELTPAQDVPEHGDGWRH
jgi:hypothetical protein